MSREQSSSSLKMNDGPSPISAKDDGSGPSGLSSGDQRTPSAKNLSIPSEKSGFESVKSPKNGSVKEPILFSDSVSSMLGQSSSTREVAAPLEDVSNSSPNLISGPSTKDQVSSSVKIPDPEPSAPPAAASAPQALDAADVDAIADLVSRIHIPAPLTKSINAGSSRPARKASRGMDTNLSFSHDPHDDYKGPVPELPTVSLSTSNTPLVLTPTGPTVTVPSTPSTVGTSGSVVPFTPSRMASLRDAAAANGFSMSGKGTFDALQVDSTEERQQPVKRRSLSMLVKTHTMPAKQLSFAIKNADDSNVGTPQHNASTPNFETAKKKAIELAQVLAAKKEELAKEMKLQLALKLQEEEAKARRGKATSFGFHSLKGGLTVHDFKESKRKSVCYDPVTNHSKIADLVPPVHLAHHHHHHHQANAPVLVPIESKQSLETINKHVGKVEKVPGGLAKIEEDAEEHAAHPQHSHRPSPVPLHGSGAVTPTKHQSGTTTPTRHHSSGSVTPPPPQHGAGGGEPAKGTVAHPHAHRSSMHEPHGSGHHHSNHDHDHGRRHTTHFGDPHSLTQHHGEHHGHQTLHHSHSSHSHSTSHTGSGRTTPHAHDHSHYLHEVISDNMIDAKFGWQKARENQQSRRDLRNQPIDLGSGSLPPTVGKPRHRGPHPPSAASAGPETNSPAKIPILLGPLTVKAAPPVDSASVASGSASPMKKQKSMLKRMKSINSIERDDAPAFVNKLIKQRSELKKSFSMMDDGSGFAFNEDGSVGGDSLASTLATITSLDRMLQFKFLKVKRAKEEEPDPDDAPVLYAAHIAKLDQTILQQLDRAVYVDPSKEVCWREVSDNASVTSTNSLTSLTSPGDFERQLNVRTGKLINAYRPWSRVKGSNERPKEIDYEAFKAALSRQPTGVDPGDLPAIESPLKSSLKKKSRKPSSREQQTRPRSSSSTTRSRPSSQEKQQPSSDGRKRSTEGRAGGIHRTASTESKASAATGGGGVLSRTASKEDYFAEIPPRPSRAPSKEDFGATASPEGPGKLRRGASREDFASVDSGGSARVRRVDSSDASAGRIRRTASQEEAAMMQQQDAGSVRVRKSRSRSDDEHEGGGRISPTESVVSLLTVSVDGASTSQFQGFTGSQRTPGTASRKALPFVINVVKLSDAAPPPVAV